MFGKFNAITTYLYNALTVYQVKRFPGSKAPLFLANYTLFVAFFLSQNLYWRCKKLTIKQY